MGRQIDDEPFRSADHATGRLHQHRRGLRVFPEQPQFLDEDEPRLLAADDLAVGRDDLQLGFVIQMLDRAQMLDRLQQGSQLGVRVDHPHSGGEDVGRDLLRRRQHEQLVVVPPVQDQRRDHDPRRNRRLRILLADEQEELVDQLPRLGRIVGAENRCHEVEDEVVTCLAERRLAGDVHDPQALEDLQRRFRLVREQGRRHQAAPLDDPLFPIGASGRPLGQTHSLSSTASGRRAA